MELQKHGERLRQIGERFHTVGDWYRRTGDRVVESASFVIRMSQRFPDSELIQLLTSQLTDTQPYVIRAMEQGSASVAEAESKAMLSIAPASSTSAIAATNVPTAIVYGSPEDVQAEWAGFVSGLDVSLDLAQVRTMLESACDNPPLSPDLMKDFDDAIREYERKPADLKYAAIVHLRSVIFKRFIEPVAEHHGVPPGPQTKWFRKIRVFVLGESDQPRDEVDRAVSEAESVWRTFSGIKDGEATPQLVTAAYQSFVATFNLLLSLRCSHYVRKLN